MKNSEFSQLARDCLLPNLPEFVQNNGLLFAMPVDHMLRGITFQPSSYSREAFYLSSFIQPLYVPKEEEAGALGRRSGRWILNSNGLCDEIATWLRDEGLPLLEQVRTPVELAERLRGELNEDEPDPHQLEALAYSLILAEDYEAARRMLQDGETLLSQYIEDDKDLWADTDEEDWKYAILRRIQRVRKAFENDPRAATDILNEWRLETARNLRIEKYLAPEPSRTRN